MAACSRHIITATLAVGRGALTLQRHLTRIALCGGSPAPAPPRPTGSCVPLRRAVAVLAVTSCGMSPARLSREVCLVAAGLARMPVAGNPSLLARDSPQWACAARLCVVVAAHRTAVARRFQCGRCPRACFLGRAIATPCGATPSGGWRTPGGSVSQRPFSLSRVFRRDMGYYDK